MTQPARTNCAQAKRRAKRRASLNSLTAGTFLPPHRNQSINIEEAKAKAKSPHRNQSINIEEAKAKPKSLLTNHDPPLRSGAFGIEIAFRRGKLLFRQLPNESSLVVIGERFLLATKKSSSAGHERHQT
jgi:hypothetical protein